MWGLAEGGGGGRRGLAGRARPRVRERAGVTVLHFCARGRSTSDTSAIPWSMRWIALHRRRTAAEQEPVEGLGRPGRAEAKCDARSGAVHRRHHVASAACCTGDFPPVWMWGGGLSDTTSGPDVAVVVPALPDSIAGPFPRVDNRRSGCPRNAAAVPRQCRAEALPTDVRSGVELRGSTIVREGGLAAKHREGPGTPDTRTGCVVDLLTH